jgi:hypothetical protein
MQKYNGPTQGLGSIAQSPLAALANKEASRTGTAAAGSPAGGVPDYAKPYMAQGSQLPNYAKPYMAQAGQPSNVPDYAKAFMPKTGQPTGLPSASAPALQGLGGLGAGMKKGGKVKAKAYAKGGTVSSASKRGDGIAQRGKTKGRMV